jgi:phage major head subunit gpT-like protein
MSGQALGSRAIIGEYYKQLEQDAGVPWVNAVANMFDSDQASETYKWLGQVPTMREWKGGRNAKGLRDSGFTILNTEYESTLELEVKHLRRDKTKQLRVRIAEHVQRAQTHWASLASTLILNGAAATCYDGQYFFDTDHSEGDSGSQSNSITVDISTLPTTVHGSVTVPSPEEIAQAALQGITKITSFLDDQGEPMNETASSFVVMVPFSLYNAALSGLSLPRGTDAAEVSSQKNITVVANARLNSWTDKFVVFRTDGAVKPLICQAETDIKVGAKAEGSEYEFDNNAHQYGFSASRGASYGMWQGACLVTMT